jgi:hypothetical protein
VAILWTTISPYLFVRQSSMEVEEETQMRSEKVKLHHRLPSMKRRMSLMQKWNAIGMVFSNIATYFIILTAGTILFQNGIHNIATVQDAADALRPLAGDRSYALFAIGVIGTWLLTIPVLAGACSYILSEVLGRELKKLLLSDYHFGTYMITYESIGYRPYQITYLDCYLIWPYGSSTNCYHYSHLQQSKSDVKQYQQKIIQYVGLDMSCSDGSSSYCYDCN